MFDEKTRKRRMVISIACLILLSISVGGIIANGNVAMSIWFGVAWLLIAPALIKNLYDIKKSEELNGSVSG